MVNVRQLRETISDMPDEAIVMCRSIMHETVDDVPTTIITLHITQDAVAEYAPVDESTVSATLWVTIEEY